MGGIFVCRIVTFLARDSMKRLQMPNTHSNTDQQSDAIGGLLLRMGKSDGVRSLQQIKLVPKFTRENAFRVNSLFVQFGIPRTNASRLAPILFLGSSNI